MARNVETQEEIVKRLIEEKTERERKKLYDFYHPDREGSTWDWCCYMVPKEYNERTKPARKPIADAIQDFMTGKIENLILNCPPGSGKSLTVSLGIAQWFAYYPDESVIRNSFESSLARNFSKHIRGFINSKKFKAVSKTRLKKDNKSAEEWSLNDRDLNNYSCGGIMGNTTGRRFNGVGILDDPIKDSSYCTPSNLDYQWGWYQDVLDSRGVYNERFGRNAGIIIINTRWHIDDIAGKLLALEPERWTHIKIKALVPDVYDPNAKSYCEAIISTEELHRKLKNYKATGRLANFLAVYQQEPISESGQLFPKDTLDTFKRSDIRNKIPLAKYIVIDYANKGDDFFSAPVIYQYDDGYYMVDCVFSQDDVKKVHPQIIKKIRDHRPNIVGAETNAGGQLYVENLRKDLNEVVDIMPEIREKYQTSNKETRILASAGQIIQNIKFLVDTEQDEMYNAFMVNLTTYSKSGRNAHDDAPDSLEQFISMLNLGGMSSFVAGRK